MERDWKQENNQEMKYDKITKNTDLKRWICEAGRKCQQKKFDGTSQWKQNPNNLIGCRIRWTKGGRNRRATTAEM